MLTQGASSEQPRHRSRSASAAIFINLFFILAGAVGVMTVLSPSMFRSAAQPPSAQNLTVAARRDAQPSLSRSMPVRLIAPDISLDTSLITTGKNEKGELAVPDRHDVAAWYELSPTPGEIGPSVIVGHVDTYLGPSVFFYLKELKPGNLVYVERQDGTRATFRVDQVKLVDQDAFPTQEVYGNIDFAGLRLITCGGAFNPATGEYLQNTVVFASYMSE